MTPRSWVLLPFCDGEKSLHLPLIHLPLICPLSMLQSSLRGFPTVISSPYLGAKEGSCWRKGSAKATKDWCFLVQKFVAAVGNRPTPARPVLLPHNETHRKTRQAYSCT